MDEIFTLYYTKVTGFTAVALNIIAQALLVSATTSFVLILGGFFTSRKRHGQRDPGESPKQLKNSALDERALIMEWSNLISGSFFIILSHIITYVKLINVKSYPKKNMVNTVSKSLCIAGLVIISNNFVIYLWQSSRHDVTALCYNRNTGPMFRAGIALNAKKYYTEIMTGLTIDNYTEKANTWSALNSNFIFSRDVNRDGMTVEQISDFSTTNLWACQNITRLLNITRCVMQTTITIDDQKLEHKLNGKNYYLPLDIAVKVNNTNKPIDKRWIGTDGKSFFTTNQLSQRSSSSSSCILGGFANVNNIDIHSVVGSVQFGQYCAFSDDLHTATSVASNVGSTAFSLSVSTYSKRDTIIIRRPQNELGLFLSQLCGNIVQVINAKNQKLLTCSVLTVVCLDTGSSCIENELDVSLASISSVEMIMVMRVEEITVIYDCAFDMKAAGSYPNECNVRFVGVARATLLDNSEFNTQTNTSDASSLYLDSSFRMWPLSDTKIQSFVTEKVLKSATLDIEMPQSVWDLIEKARYEHFKFTTMQTLQAKFEAFQVSVLLSELDNRTSTSMFCNSKSNLRLHVGQTIIGPLFVVIMVAVIITLTSLCVRRDYTARGLTIPIFLHAINTVSEEKSDSVQLLKKRHLYIGAIDDKSYGVSNDIKLGVKSYSTNEIIENSAVIRINEYP